MSVPPLEKLLKRDQIDELFACYRERAPWMMPVIDAMRCGCGVLLVTQRAGPFHPPRGLKRKPTIVLIGDDLYEAQAPPGFHLPSLRRLFRELAGVAVISSEPEPDVYASVAQQTIRLRQHVGIVETSVEQEIPWLEFIQKTAPRLSILLSTVKGGTA